MPRPPKISKELIEAFKDVIEGDNVILVCTDEEIFYLLNERLDEKDQICYKTFQNYKNGAETYDANYPELRPLFNEFLRLIKKALINEKINLFRKFKTEPITWQRWAWIIERKFDEWNIKDKKEIDHLFSQGLKIGYGDRDAK